MGRQVTIAASLVGLALVLFAGAPAQADEYGAVSRAQRHHSVRHTHYLRAHYASCAERVVVRQTGYRYYPRAQLYSFEPQDFTRTYCARAVAVNWIFVKSLWQRS